MDRRLQTWVATGEYVEEDAARRATDTRLRKLSGRSRGRIGPGAGPLEGLVSALLVPAGILVGILLAAALIARLLMIPFGLLSGSRPGRQ
jgi:hypothetical protein